jgi:hypothetical protein
VARSVMVDFSPLMPNETKQKRQVAKIELLETFTLGKNTRKNSGIKITVFSKAEKKLGTITIGAGSFQWSPTSAKKRKVYLLLSELFGVVFQRYLA